jgi:3-methyl-2-oxobutanoate hydroxymethyltransferase
MRAQGEPIAMLTCYDASFARLLDDAGVDVVLVGDSLGMVLQGHATTLPVTLEHMAYHVACVARGLRSAWLVADLPHGSYHRSPGQAMDAATTLQRGVPVCAHLGLTPQAVHALGGWRVQGREAAQAQAMLVQAHELQDAGASMLVLELVPAALAERITQALRIPVVGIGAGPACSGQVLVLHDMLGLATGRVPRFVRDFMDGAGSVPQALRAYVQAVRERRFPDPQLHAS